MRKTGLLLLALMLVTSIFAIDTNINLSNANTTDVNILRSDNAGLSMQYSIDEIKSYNVNTKRGQFSQLVIDGYTKTHEVGSPALPMSRKIIAVPLEAQIITNIVSNNETRISLVDNGIENQLFPAQESVSKSADPALLPFVVNDAAYQEMTRSPLVKVVELGIMRSVRLVAIDVMPVQYDPENSEIVVYNNIELEIDFVGADYAATEDLRNRTFSPAFESVYKSTVFNYESNNSRANLTRYPIKYVVISDPMFETQMQPFIDWKKEQGYNVIEKYTNDPEVGSTTNSIKAYMQSLWAAATTSDPAPTYLLIVGDVDQVPAFNGSTGTHITDLDYVKLEGADYMPEMYYGRFSANNTSELQPQIDKTLMYERLEMSDTSYLDNVTLIAGVDSNYAPTHGNGQIVYGTTNYFNAEHNLETNAYYYPESGSAASSIISDLNDGVALINYTAHGYDQEWSDPNIDNNDLAALTNSEKYTVAIGNCCLTNKFQVTTCFGEQWLRVPDKGGVAYIGGTNSTYWDEDYFWGVGFHSGAIDNTPPALAQTGIGVYDGMFHENGEAFENWYTTTGSMISCGNLAVVEAAGTRLNYYWEIYSLMGDPSLTPFVGLPTENTASLPATIFIGVDQVEISAEPYSYVAVSMDGELHGVALVDATGSATISIDPFLEAGDAKIVITAQNKIPVIQTVPVVPNDGPYVTIDSHIVSAGGNSVIEYGETVNLSVDMTNIGNEDATSVQMTISTDDTYVTIIDNTEDLNDINSNEVVSYANAFQFEVSENVPNNHTITFSSTCTSGENVWSNQFSFNAYAPVLELNDVIINDANGNSNGMLDAGEEVSIIVPIRNIGGAISEDITVNLASQTDFITISESEVVISSVASGVQSSAVFTVTVGTGAQDGDVAEFATSITSGLINISDNFDLMIGLIFDGFESGAFTTLDWTNNANGFQISTDAYEGINSAQSVNINDSQEAVLTLNVDVTSETEISFYRKVSSESGYDKLKFFVGDSEVADWSGNADWEQFTFTVPAGTQTLAWKYAKDGSVSNGDDCGWIDNVLLGAGSVVAPTLNVVSDDLNFGGILLNETETRELTISNIGMGNLTGTIATPAGYTLRIDETRLYTKDGKLRNEVSYDLAPNETMAFFVDFTPTEEIEYNGNIVVTSNDPGNGTVNIAVTGSGQMTSIDFIPEVTGLIGNYPNPFNPTTKIRFNLSKSGNVSLVVFNVKGQKVKTLINEHMEAGSKDIIWNGKSNSNDDVASGMYFYRMTAEGKTQTKKMVLMK